MNNNEVEQELYRIHGLLCKVAYSILRNKDDVEDAVSETMYIALKNFDKLKDKSKFESWTLKILKNECFKFYKRYKNDEKLIDKVKNSMDFTYDFPDIENIEDNMSFEELIKGLNEDEKKVFNLYFKDNKSLSKISKTLEENPNTIRSRYRRGKEKIKELSKNGFKKIAFIILISIIFTSGLTITGAFIKNHLKTKVDYEIHYNNKQIENVEYNIDNNKFKLKIDFNEEEINRDNFEIYLENNPIYLITMDKTEKVIYPESFDWLEEDVFEIEFDCNNVSLGSNASVHIVLKRGESITILLKK